MKVSLSQKLKLAQFGLWFARHYPKLALAGVMTASGHYVKTYFDAIHAQIDSTKEHIVELKKQNDYIQQANEAMVEDMRGIKLLTEKYQSRVQSIRSESKVLQKNFESEKFTKLIQEDAPKAEQKFNSDFNQYLNNLNELTNATK